VGVRVVQAALKLVLEPIFEADFASVSYGFGPAAEHTTRSPRSTSTAIPSHQAGWTGLLNVLARVAGDG
jgi:RNA-directed DNA polymerase